MTEESTAQKLQAEAAYLTGIGVLLSSSPQHEQLLRLASEDVFSAIPFAEEQSSTQEGACLLAGWAEAYEESQLDALKSDYMKLFEGPGMPKAPLWESVYANAEERLIFQEETLYVRNWYKRFGLQIQNLYKEPDDNLAFELQFIGHLTNKAAEALAADNAIEAQKFLDARRRFCAEHLLRWGFEWCILATKEAGTTFYKGLTYLVEGILTELEQQSRGGL
jgi:TorA maturation chaperone TorD